MITSTLTLFIIYILSPILVFGVVNKFIGIEKKESRLLTLLCCLGWGPAVISYFASWVMLVVPKLDADVYRGFIAFSVLVLIFIQRKQYKSVCADLGSLYKELISPLLQNNFMSRSLLIVFVGVMLLFVGATQYSPVVGNDALEYRKVSGFLTETRNFRNYPIHDSTASRGLYAPWSHPPGFVGLSTVTNILKGDTIWDFGFKIINPIYVFLTILLMMGIMRFVFKKPPHVGVVAGFVLMSTPVFAWQANLVHVDSFRLFFSLSTAVCLLQLLNAEKIRLYLVLTGISAGLGVFAHSLGLLTLPMVCIAYLLLSREAFQGRIVNTTLMMIVAFSVVLKTIFNNLIVNGVFAGDLGSIKVIGLQKLAYGEYLEISRGLGSNINLMLNGLLAKSAFGYSYVFFVFSLALIVFFKLSKSFSKEARQMYLISLSFILTFYGILFGTLLLGSHALAKNNRYYLSIHIFIALLSALGLWEVLTRILNKEDRCDEINA